ncbi:hypothetical protein AVANI_11 [Mycobacterium phage Avani]|uniref:Uncharacterized protein n=6 Tax=Avanivirus TaxID=2843352 RepID=A0A2D1G9U2_9CAUD|nr:hypothetical protein PBI_CHE9D_11 [Mycobacterium phage Che9d]YP_008410683.1 hypothetical protein N850_gp012 [Mycobacterium phage Jabbawokkie]YP_009013106.1 hypothetical protein CL78_gp011 [Mycobacterium phage Avani]YP_009613915.1 hypothetical protein FDI59_gp011 [Mycobacterium phage Yoshi]YP_009963709.1 hypothetical protein I5I02_gp011 [Mycobacterium phage Demsculpinboyz]YP_009963826.1 hypothetical protein I5I03_gp011 [Mycobacterium phage Soul22]YP_009963929.1 hypothetical protein I5I04_gp
MIVVHTHEELAECEGATRFSTDEHNNLCIWGGSKTDQLLGVFHAGHWVKVVVEDDDQG